ncbi:hypothetical protein SEPCBS57363_000879 [Sporothrix epigloea]|uniref:ABC1 atypical kinase-like domain-containing protein n=1 Tax=Sporothrix epigloea TaxID=1892477 RepID=A0ABP0D784_9PEZI
MAGQDVTMGSALVLKRSDTELMPPPPPAKRIQRPKTVLDEDTYTDGLSKIIARDFFPGLLESETQNEYLNALESKDPRWIGIAGKRLQEAMTPGRRHRSRLQTPRHWNTLDGRPGETPQSFAGDTPASVISMSTTAPVDTAAASTATKTGPELDISLGAFQAKYTSEDNESFYKLLDKQNQKRVEKHAWLWNGNKLPSKMQLKQKEVRDRLLSSGTSLVDSGHKKDRLAIQDRDFRPAAPEMWKEAPKNALMFQPDSQVEGQMETVAQKRQAESLAAPKSIVYANTRLPGTTILSAQQQEQKDKSRQWSSLASNASLPPSPTLSAVRDAIAGKPRRIDMDSTAGSMAGSMVGGETPRVNGYSFVDDEEAEPVVEAPPVISFGKVDSTPNPFQLQDTSRREGLHHRMVERIAQNKRTSVRIAYWVSPRNFDVQRGFLDVHTVNDDAEVITIHFLSRNLLATSVRTMRFLDLAADIASVVSASRSIATKHAALRSRQIGASYPSAPDDSKHVSPEKPTDESERTGGTPVPEAKTARAPSVASSAPVELSDDSPPTTLFMQDTASNSKQSDVKKTPVPHSVEMPGEPEEQVEPVLPIFIHRAQLRSTKPPDVRRRHAADLAGSNIEQSRLHPLDPRLKQQTHKPLQTAPKGSSTKQTPTVSAAVSHSIKQGVFGKDHGEPLVASFAETSASKALPGTVTGEVVVNDSPAPGPSPMEKVVEERRETQDAPIANSESTSEVVATQEQSLPSTPVAASTSKRAFELKESKVPATRLSRIWNYGGLAAGMLGGALSESISRGFRGGSGDSGSVMLSAGNLERLVSRLSRMRGAALKLGQMMSFQDAKMLPAPLQEVLQRVQDGADYMPAWQRDRVLATNLGADWRALFSEFEEKPLAAASIGQVHRATLASNGAAVAVKIQFPGVADSINSDLDNLGILLTATRMLPRGLYLDKTIANARTELAWECDYEREAACAQRFETLLADAGETSAYLVPKVFLEASGKQVLTMSFMGGVGVTKVAPNLSQEQRDWIGTQILRLCLLEITQFNFMQTDPNWTNFLYNASTSKLELLDFGASREYPADFINQYVRLLRAAAQSDIEGVHTLSQDLGYLTGHESRAMLDAHTQSVMTLAEPFHRDAPEVYDFQDQTITDRVRSFIPIMVRERLAPPPEETYSLHRKLSGAFLLCARLGSRVKCRSMFEDSLKKMGLA